jgi:Na+-translocating ferredoxin:NAD+ oxidoreductase subunit B
MSDVYQKLAEHLDTLPQRYPVNTGTGLELKILKHIFTPEEAEVAVHLLPAPEPAAAIAERLGRDPAETEEFLYGMSKKGQIMRVGKPGGYRYMALPFFVGIIEFQINRLSQEYVEDLQKFYPILFEHTWLKGKTRELRTIPIDKTVAAESEVLPYESAEAIIRSNKNIAVTECMCRKMKAVLGQACDRPTEVCFQFGGATHFMVENGLSRRIEQEEALAILEKGIESGLVVQVGSPQNPGGMCLCCSCCCGPLESYRRFEKPASFVNSNYYAAVDHDTCTACGICETRCQMEAITVGDTALVNRDRCIGCGLCVRACEFDAVKLVKKDEADRWTPQADYLSTVMDIQKERREG